MSIKVTKRSKDYSRWYTDVVQKAELADYGPVKGTMVIRPYGYAIWENIRNIADRMFKETGHVNAYFPLLIPESFMKKEAEHVEGFAPECAVVTHGGGKKLDEPLYIRPTSETIIWSMYKKWINSYRDLPLLINQWANVVRWEMRTRLFLRTTEFLWQEGHTAHSSYEEAEAEARKMIEIYRQIAEDYMAMPVYVGKKTDAEKFAGAVYTYTIEAMMGDKKALQSGTSHNLGQNFAKAFDVTFLSRENKQEYVYATSWGISTRLVGGVIMTHGDDKGLILPPQIAPYHLVIVPIWRTAEQKKQLMEEVAKITHQFNKEDVRYIIDDNEQTSPGWKFNQWEMKGVPLRMEIGPKDLENNQVVLVRRDTGEKQFIPTENLFSVITGLLEEIQNSLFQRALEFRDRNTHEVDNYADFKKIIESGGFVKAFWAGDGQMEAMIQEQTGATIRCIPFKQDQQGTCFYTGKPSGTIAIFAKSY
ncbi:MAG TPA: proline--tRNA ligase [Candidatus Marinimicrobia bacterium]|nr:proline--tRNA ligase [Candidatus Neomarinimicrobiota bacterium]